MDTFSNTFLLAYLLFVVLIFALAWLVWEGACCWKQFDVEQKCGITMLASVIVVVLYYVMTQHLIEM